MSVWKIGLISTAWPYRKGQNVKSEDESQILHATNLAFFFKKQIIPADCNDLFTCLRSGYWSLADIDVNDVICIVEEHFAILA